MHGGGTNTVKTEWQYDELGRVEDVLQYDSNMTTADSTVSYEYNDVGQITKLTQPSSGGSGTEITTYFYDGLGRIDNIKHNGNKIREYDYLSTGQLEETVDYLKFDQGNTTSTMSTEYLYTGLGQVKEIKYVKDSTSATLEKYNYTYDRNGNITEEVSYLSYAGTTQTKEYYYDPLGRVKRMDYGDDRADYFYDKVGNRTREKYFNREGMNWLDLYKYTDWEYNEFDQLTKISMYWNNPENRLQWISKFSYDAKGELIASEEREYNDVWYYTLVDTGFVDENGESQMVYRPVYRYGGLDGAFESAMVYNSTYRYDKAGYLHKETNEISDKVYEDTYHYYNGMEQPGRMGEQLRSNDQPVKKVIDLATDDVTKYTYANRIQLFTTNGLNDRINNNILTPSGYIIRLHRRAANFAKFATSHSAVRRNGVCK